MSQRTRYLWSNTASLALGKLGTRLISFLLVPLYTRTLTAGEYGTVDFLATVVTVLAPILMLNISEAVMRFGLDPAADHPRIMRTALLVLGGGAAVGALLIPVCAHIPALAPYRLLLYGYAIALACSQVFLYHLRGQEKLVAYSVGTILQTAAAGILNLLFLLVFRWGVSGYLLAYLLAHTVTALYAAIVGRVDRAFVGVRLDPALAGAMIRYSAVLIPNTFLWWIIHSSDRLMVTALVGAAANGVYAVAYKVPSLLSTLSGVFNQAWSYSAIREEQSADREGYYNAVYHRLVQVLQLVTSAMLLGIRPFLRWYAPPAYGDAWRYTPFLCLGCLFLSLGTFLSSLYTVHKDSPGFLCSSLLGAGVNLLLNFLWIPAFGVLGAAAATGFSYFAVFLFRVVHTRKYVALRVLRPQHLLGYALLIAMGGGLFLPGIWGMLLPGALAAALLVLLRRDLGTLFGGLCRFFRRRKTRDTASK